MRNHATHQARRDHRSGKPAALGEESDAGALTIREILRSCGGMEWISVLKIDIEGAEVELFPSNTNEWIDKSDKHGC
jgi:hypothetical protein